MEWLNKVRHIHAMEYYTAIKKNEVKQNGPIQKNIATYLEGGEQVASHITIYILDPLYFKNIYVFACVKYVYSMVCMNTF